MDGPIPDPATLDAEGDDDVVCITESCRTEFDVDSYNLAPESCEREGSTGTRNVTATFVYF